jgi:hypothetical protein
MKSIWPLLAAALVLSPLAANAQGYSGVMAPQSGYRAPAPAAAPAGGPGSGPAAAPASHAQTDPYGGTGASDATGYMSMMNGGDSATPDYAVQEPAQTDDLGEPVKPGGSPFMQSLAPKKSDDDDHAGVSIYDQVQENGSGSATERRRQAIIRKIDKEQRQAAEEAKRANAQRDRDIKAQIKKTVRDTLRKKRGDDGTDDTDDMDDQDQDQDNDQSQDVSAADDSSPDAVKE